MDFYFTDRKYNLLGIASTDAGGSSTVIQLSDDGGQQGDYQSVVGSYRSFSAEMHYAPDQSEHVKQMAAVGNFILYKARDGSSVWTTILTLDHDPSSGTDTIIAEDASVDLINGTVGPYTATSAMKMDAYIKLFAGDSGFEIGYNEIPDYSRTLKWDSGETTILERLQSLATQFDAEISFRFELSGLSVIKKYIDIVKHIGSDRGVQLFVDKQINKIVTTTDIADLCTAINGTGSTPEGSDTPINLKNYKWTDPDGRFVLGTDGILRDPVSMRNYTRLTDPSVSNANGYITRVRTYEAETQATLLQSVLADLKQRNHPVVNYNVDISVLPSTVQIGDTIHLVDESDETFLSARVLELYYSYSSKTGTAVLGDYLIEANDIDPQLLDMANTVKMLKAQKRYWPWTRYADDNKGTGISSLPLGKAYMAVVWGKTATPSDDPADYAGHWQKVTGADGSIGKVGPPGADGKSQYIHTAYAKSADGVDGFSTTSSTGSSYMGTCVDDTEPDPTYPSAYTWVRFKGDDAITLTVTSINGNMFKNSGISTVLTVTITYGGDIIDNSSKLSSVMGDDNYLQWQVMNIGETEYSDLSRDDHRILDNGFMLTVNVNNVNQKATYRCQLHDNN